ncbi:hypothetical protein [Oceaniglobus indicus]|uniref:hypothetical protein n=1 Tax=Oceaniglobus indicus TaxID=2047749 RepID=UPI000C17A2F7|nr:hypothetical protein [Oceaniglobus indicus]
MAVDLRALIGPAYGIALVIHGLFVVFVIGAGATSAVFVAGTANAWRSDLLAFPLILLPALLGALPSIIALLSWFLLWRRDRRPSVGHRVLTTGWAAVLVGLTVFGMANAQGGAGA